VKNCGRPFELPFDTACWQALKGEINTMNSRYTQLILTAIAILLAILVVRQYYAPSPVQAQNAGIYVEPGYTNLRSPDGLALVQGKMVVNLNTGEIWGFPTLTGGPYPIDGGKTTPPVSKPMYLGQFDFSAMHR
jgi:hypothetical protein